MIQVSLTFWTLCLYYEYYYYYYYYYYCPMCRQHYPVLFPRFEARLYPFSTSTNTDLTCKILFVFASQLRRGNTRSLHFIYITLCSLIFIS